MPVFALAQTASPTDGDDFKIEEVVVTARKRSETVQDVPASVGVVSAEALVAKGAVSLTQLPAVAPGVNMTKSPSSNEFGVTIRGLGSSPGNSSFDSSVSLFVDGVYAPRNREFAAAMFDIDRIEVIRGTQAALLGKNTSLGAVNIITRRPGNALAADLRVAREFEVGGNLVSGGVDLPVSDTFKLRLSGQYTDSDGPVKNVVTGKTAVRLQDAALRAVATWKPTDRLDVTLFAQRDRVDNDGTPAEFVATTGVPELLQARAGAPGTIDTKLDWKNAASSPNSGGEQAGQLISTRYAATINYDLNGYTLTAITGVSKMVNRSHDDYDFQAGDYFYGTGNEIGKQFTQEVRLVSPANRPFNYIVGALYLDGSLDIDSTRIANYPFGPAPGVNVAGAFAQTFDQDTKAVSLFGQGVYKLTDRLRAQAGLRWTSEDKDVDLSRKITTPGLLSTVLYPPYAPFSRSHDEKNLDYSAGLQYDLSSNANLYVSYGQGTKSGGFASSVSLLDKAEYDKEVAHTAEIGLKLQGEGRRWVFNVAGFNTKVDDFQLVTFTGAQFDIGNTDLRSRGVEVETYWYPVRGLRLFANGTYADAKDLKTGAVPPLAPKLTASAGFAFSTPISEALELKLDGSVDHRSKRYYQRDTASAPAGEAFTTLNAGVAIAASDARWELRLIGRNLTNENALSFSFPTPIVPAGNYSGISEQPRTVALQLSLKY
ncbi:TonB-dependent receptor [Caulobacter soli]|uniref:TonB-dependent receptor n=1 Tax=Caulobacter soli TaxID=2708539 RepID=UPI0013EA82CC|nr:TonB-dependent receptor [Caulobacter soli]